MMVSGLHNVCQKGYYIAMISTIVETNNPEAEIQSAIELIGAANIREKFVQVSLMIPSLLSDNRFFFRSPTSTSPPVTVPKIRSSFPTPSTHPVISKLRQKSSSAFTRLSLERTLTLTISQRILISDILISARLLNVQTL